MTNLLREDERARLDEIARVDSECSSESLQHVGRRCESPLICGHDSGRRSDERSNVCLREFAIATNWAQIDRDRMGYSGSAHSVSSLAVRLNHASKKNASVAQALFRFVVVVERRRRSKPRACEEAADIYNFFARPRQEES